MHRVFNFGDNACVCPNGDTDKCHRFFARPEDFRSHYKECHDEYPEPQRPRTLRITESLQRYLVASKVQFAEQRAQNQQRSLLAGQPITSALAEQDMAAGDVPSCGMDETSSRQRTSDQPTSTEQPPSPVPSPSPPPLPPLRPSTMPSLVHTTNLNGFSPATAESLQFGPANELMRRHSFNGSVSVASGRPDLATSEPIPFGARQRAISHEIEGLDTAKTFEFCRAEHSQTQRSMEVTKRRRTIDPSSTTVIASHDSASEHYAGQPNNGRQIERNEMSLHTGGTNDVEMPYRWPEPPSTMGIDDVQTFSQTQSCRRLSHHHLKILRPQSLLLIAINRPHSTSRPHSQQYSLWSWILRVFSDLLFLLNKKSSGKCLNCRESWRNWTQP